MKFLPHTRINQFLTATLVAVLMFSAIGIAQVSHLCKMAAMGVEKTDCRDLANDAHPCCESIPVSDQKEDCCNDIVKFYQGTITVILKESLQLDQVCFTDGLIVELVHTSELPTKKLFTERRESIFSGSGHDIIISKSSLLI